MNSQPDGYSGKILLAFNEETNFQITEREKKYLPTCFLRALTNLQIIERGRKNFLLIL